MRGLILALFGLIVFSGVQPSEAQTPRHHGKVREARVHTPAAPAVPQYGCVEHPKVLTRAALREFERMPADSVMVHVVLPGNHTQGIQHRAMTVAAFTVSVRVPHSALRRTMNETVNEVHRCIFGSANADGVVVPTESLMYRVSGGFSENGATQRAYIGLIALPRDVVNTAPLFTTVLSNGVELFGVWREGPQGQIAVVLEPAPAR